MRTIKLTFILVALLINFSFSQSWFQQYSGTTSDLTSVQFVNTETGWTSASNGSVLKTTNGGSNWISYSSGNIHKIWSIYFINENLGYACGDSGSVLMTTNGGMNWFSQQSGTINDLFSIRFINSLTGWVAGMQQVIRTTNGGLNWIKQSTNSGWSIWPISSNTIFMCNSGIVKSTNFGINWTYVWSSALYNTLDICFLNSTTGIAVGNGYPGPLILRSTNSGQNWSAMFPSGGGSLWSVFFINADSGWTCSMYAEIYFTSNSGLNWSTQNSGLNYTQGLLDIFFVDNSTGWAVGNLGTIIKTTNGGNPIGIEPISENIPERFALYQNYPNPFNPSTKINFNIPKSTFVNLIVYDALGREVAYLVNDKLGVGQYSYEWDAASYPSGIYFYKLFAEDYSDTKKMVLNGFNKIN